MKAKGKKILAFLLACVMLLTTAVSVSAEDTGVQPQAQRYILTVNVTGDGDVELSGDGIELDQDGSYAVLPGSTVNLTAVPGENSQLKSMALDGSTVSGSFVMPEKDAVLDAVFETVQDTAEISAEGSGEAEGNAQEIIQPEETMDTEEPEEPDADLNSVQDHARGIDLSSYVMLATTRSAGIPSIGDQVTGTCYIGDTWNVNYPYQDYFHVSNFSGELAGAVTVQDFECLDPTAALPSHTWASYVATVTEVNMVEGYVEYSVRVTPPGATDGTTTDGSGHLTGYQHVGGKVRIPRQFTGSIELWKSSANPELTDGNSCYSREGAVYGVYSGADKVAQMTTDSNGYAKVDNIPVGNYTVKEITAPKGYALDLTAHNVTVVSGQTATVKVTDLPQSDPVSILLGKIDRETTQNMPQGSASLEGAEFTVKFYGVESDEENPTDPAEEGVQPLRTWVLKTDQLGRCRLDDNYKIAGDDLWKNSFGVATLPLGILTIQETKAPEGYLLNDEVFVRQITSSGTAESVNTYNEPTIPEDIIRGDIQIIKYGESNAESDDSGADIKPPLEFVKFHLQSKTTGETFTIVTDENGIASTVQLGISDRGNLAFDTYIVTEESPYPEYDEVEPFEVTISEEGQTLYYILRNDTVDAPIQVQKVDETTGKVIQAAGAKFQVLDADKNPVKMTVSHYPSLVETDTFETDDNGMFVLPEKLEYGTYYLHEVEAPEGYLLGGEDIPFTVDEEYQWGEPLVVEYADAPAMGRIELVKTDSETGDPLEGAEFTVTAAEDIVTGDGTLRAAAGEVVDTLVTDQDGRFVTKDLYLGKYTVTETKQPAGYVLPEKSFDVELVYKDQHTVIVTEKLEVENQPTTFIIDKKVAGSEDRLEGVKFVIWNKDKEDPVDPGMTYKEIYVTDENGKIQLPYLESGNYCVKEVEGVPGYAYDDTVYEFIVDDTGRINGEGTYTLIVENEKTEIVETNVINVDTGSQQAYPKQLHAVDTVSLAKLMPGVEYQLKGTVVDSVTGLPIREGNSLTGEEVTVETTFTASDSAMDVEVEFMFDASALAGRTVTVYEYLYQDGIEIDAHTDKDDTKQQIKVMDPQIYTTVIDVESGTQTAEPDADVHIRDKVYHSDLIPGVYQMRGVVMSVSTGLPLIVNGEEVVTEKEVTVSEAEDMFYMDFRFDGSELAGQQVVIYEYLYQNGELVKSHEDINAKNQTIWFKEKIQEQEQPESPSVKTGDDGELVYQVIGLAMMAVSVGLLIFAIASRKRKNKRQEKDQE